MIPRDVPAERGLSQRIDLLVDGELSEVDRRALLASLDAAPDGWRRCALAFLEAQAWRGVFTDAARTHMPVLPVPARPGRRLAPWLATAAAALVAFGAGRMTRAPEVAVPIASAAPSPAPPTSAPTSPRPGVAAIPQARPAAPVDYVSGRLEREGFRVERSRGFVPAKTKDGRPIAVPVQRTTVRYVGNRAV